MRKLFIMLVAGVLAFVLMPTLVAQADGGDAKCYKTVVVTAAYTETIEHPAVTHEETVTVVDSPAYDETVPATEDRWENLSWFVWTGGPRDTAPGLDEDGWNDVPALPNGLPHEPVPGTVYNVSHGESGRGSWFKYDGDFIPGTPEHTVEHPAVTHEETVTVVDVAAWTETVEHPVVTGQVEVPCDTDEPPVPPVDEEPPVIVVPPELPNPNPPAVKPHEGSKPVALPVAVPTAVAAGK